MGTGGDGNVSRQPMDCDTELACMWFVTYQTATAVRQVVTAFDWLYY